MWPANPMKLRFTGMRTMRIGPSRSSGASPGCRRQITSTSWPAATSASLWRRTRGSPGTTAWTTIAIRRGLVTLA